MEKQKFKFNDKTLLHERVELTLRERLRKAGLHLGFSLGLALVFAVLSYPVVRSLSNSEVIEENDKLKEVYDEMNGKIYKLSQQLAVLKLRDDSVYTSIFGVAPISKSLRIGGSGGTDEFSDLKGYSNSDLMLQSAQLVAQLEDQVQIHKHGFERIKKMAGTRSEKLARIPAIQPIHNHELIRTASGFGMRMHPVYKVMKMHTGIDFTAKVGTEIFVTGDGVVKEVENSYSGYGKHIVVDHGFGYQTLYAHLSSAKVRVGQKVNRGDLIGLVGNTGTSTAPHLHYEVIKDGRKIDPAHFFFNDLNFEQYQEMIRISSNVSTTLD